MDFKDFDEYKGDENLEGLVKNMIVMIILIIAQVDRMISSQFIGDRWGIDVHLRVTSAWQADDICIN